VANTAQAKKRIRQSEKRHLRNMSLRSMYRTYIKKVTAAIEAKQVDAAKEALKKAIPIIDKMVTKGIIHTNKAARHKSRLNASLKKIM
jgi:small subunit ribosomal protein S20